MIRWFFVGPNQEPYVWPPRDARFPGGNRGKLRSRNMQHAHHLFSVPPTADFGGSEPT